MLNSTADNPKVPPFLQFVTSFECLVVVSTALVLFFLPDLGQLIWAWSAPPFNSRFVGAIYWAALAPLLIFAITGRWVPGRLVLWMIFVFTTSIMFAMLIHSANFEWDRPATWGFWFLYIFLPINSAVHLYLLRNLSLADVHPTPTAWRYGLIAAAIILGLYGFGLLFTPDSVTAFWPWPVDSFHGRIYAATFLTPAVGAWLIRDKGAPSEYFTLGLTLTILGVTSIIGLFLASASVPVNSQVDLAALGTWGYLLMNIVCGLFGGGLMILGYTSVAQASAQATAATRPAHLRPQMAVPVGTTKPLNGEVTVDLPRMVLNGRRYRLDFANNKKIEFYAQFETFVGRADPANEWSPAVDLTPYGGEAEGVSRRHARIFAQGTQLYVEDLGSHHGTFVNEKRLAPNKPAQLKANDRLRFGALNATFQAEG